VTLALNRPWSNIGTAHRLSILDICAKLFVNPTRGSKDIERTWNTVIQCLILDCDLDLEPTFVKHRHCKSSHHTWHLCKVICKSHQGFKRYRADTKVWWTDGQTDNGAKTICLSISWYTCTRQALLLQHHSNIAQLYYIQIPFIWALLQFTYHAFSWLDKFRNFWYLKS